MTEMRITRNDGTGTSTVWARDGEVAIGIDEDDETAAVATFTVEQAMLIMAQLGAAILEAQTQ